MMPPQVRLPYTLTAHDLRVAGAALVEVLAVRAQASIDAGEADSIERGAEIMHRVVDDAAAAQHPMWAEQGRLEDVYFAIRLAIHWGLEGFPQVDVRGKLAASLMATSMPAELIPQIEAPWSTFSVMVPDGLLRMRFTCDACPEEHVFEMRRATITVKESGLALFFHYASIGGPGEKLTYALADSLAKLTEAETKPLFDVGERMPTHGHGTKLIHRVASVVTDERRIFRMALRFLLGVCVELDTPAHRSVISAANNDGRGRIRRRSKKPVSWTYKLTRDVRVDCREWVRGHCLGTRGTSPTVQVLVKGHHKNQAHGPGMALRKWIHIEPYWRGPEDAPIAVRSHVVGKDRDEPT